MKHLVTFLEKIIESLDNVNTETHITGYWYIKIFPANIRNINVSIRIDPDSETELYINWNTIFSWKKDNLKKIHARHQLYIIKMCNMIHKKVVSKILEEKFWIKPNQEINNEINKLLQKTKDQIISRTPWIMDGKRYCNIIQWKDWYWICFYSDEVLLETPNNNNYPLRAIYNYVKSSSEFSQNIYKEYLKWLGINPKDFIIIASHLYNRNPIEDKELKKIYNTYSNIIRIATDFWSFRIYRKTNSNDTFGLDSFEMKLPTDFRKLNASYRRALANRRVARYL